MAVDYFLKIDGIDGESPDKKHPNEIQLLSWSWAADQPGTMSTGGGGGTGKAQFAPLTVTKYYDKASPLLADRCSSGEHIKKATLIGRKAGKEQQEYLKFELTDVLISSVSIGGNTEQPIETVSIHYSKWQFDYAEQKADGTLGAHFTSGWDVKANVKV